MYSLPHLLLFSLLVLPPRPLPVSCSPFSPALPRTVNDVTPSSVELFFRPSHDDGPLVSSTCPTPGVTSLTTGCFGTICHREFPFLSCWLRMDGWKNKPQRALEARRASERNQVGGETRTILRRKPSRAAGT